MVHEHSFAFRHAQIKSISSARDCHSFPAPSPALLTWIWLARPTALTQNHPLCRPARSTHLPTNMKKQQCDSVARRDPESRVRALSATTPPPADRRPLVSLLVSFFKAPPLVSSSSAAPSASPGDHPSARSVGGVVMGGRLVAFANASERISLAVSAPGPSCTPSAATVAGASVACVSARSALSVKPRRAVAPGSVAVAQSIVVGNSKAPPAPAVCPSSPPPSRRGARTSSSCRPRRGSVAYVSARSALSVKPRRAVAPGSVAVAPSIGVGNSKAPAAPAVCPSSSPAPSRRRARTSSPCRPRRGWTSALLLLLATWCCWSEHAVLADALCCDYDGHNDGGAACKECVSGTSAGFYQCAATPWACDVKDCGVLPQMCARKGVTTCGKGVRRCEEGRAG